VLPHFDRRAVFEDDDVERIAQRVAALLVDLLSKPEVSPWKNSTSAARYLDCVESRIHKLTSTGGLPVHHEGGRCLYRTDELDQFVIDGGGQTH
jgi:hypothetical protein